MAQVKREKDERHDPRKAGRGAELMPNAYQPSKAESGADVGLSTSSIRLLDSLLAGNRPNNGSAQTFYMKGRNLQRFKAKG